MAENIIVCTRCIMDSRAPGIFFDDHGVCNYCKLYDDLNVEYPLGDAGQRNLTLLVDQIKRSARGKKYDCIIGISGGTDSTYTAYLAKKMGLNPLAVHFDNGWNSEIAVSNIKNALQKLNIDLYTYVVDWEEFKDLQLSFLRASTPDIEVPTDLAIVSILYKVASDEGLKYILNGVSFRTEGNMPFGWVYADGKYISAVQKIFGTVPLKTFPNLTLIDVFYYTMIKKIKVIRFLNLVEYSKDHARAVIEKELGWKYYGGHHFESIYTRFYQGYISPIKFNIDRRIVSLSAQVRSNQISRADALAKIQTSHYSEELIAADREYIAKKLGISPEEFTAILAQPAKSFLDYPSYYPLLKKMKNVIKFASKTKLIPVIYHENKYSL